MEFPPTEHSFFEAEAFETAAPRNPGELGVELMAQIRPNGRIVDHWRLATGGSKILEAKIRLSMLMPLTAELPEWYLVYQCWPADLAIRRNMTSSAWMEVKDMLASNKLTVVDHEETQVAGALVTEAMSGMPHTANSAALRWAISVSASGKLELQLQALPVPLSSLTKPIFKR